MAYLNTLFDKLEQVSIETPAQVTNGNWVTLLEVNGAGILYGLTGYLSKTSNQSFQGGWRYYVDDTSNSAEYNATSINIWTTSLSGFILEITNATMGNRANNPFIFTSLLKVQYKLDTVATNQVRTFRAVYQKSK